MELRYQGTDPRDGWQPGEVREVGDDTAAALIATGLWVAPVVAPRVPGPPLDRMMRAPGGKPWP